MGAIMSILGGGVYRHRSVYRHWSSAAFLADGAGRENGESMPYRANYTAWVKPICAREKTTCPKSPPTVPWSPPDVSLEKAILAMVLDFCDPVGRS